MKQWDEFLREQEAELGGDVVDKWLRTLKVVNFDACNLYLEGKDLFHLEWFEEHVRKRLVTFKNENQKPIKVHLRVKGIEKRKRTQEEILEFQLEFETIDPYARLENYVPSKENVIPFTFIKELGTTLYNPLYLYGKSGTGKTHLLMGIAHKFKELGKKVIYVNAQVFTSHLVKAIRNGMMQNFRSSYRCADLLIIDDVHIFANRSATQEEIFHTFNYLHGEKRQIVLSANCAPQLLTDVEPRLVSRFEWGITLHLAKQENLREVLLKKAELLQFPLTEELETFLLENFHSIKSQQKALMTLILGSHLQKNAPPSKLLKELLEEENKNKLTSEKIIQQTAIYYGIRPTDILGKSQSQECSLPRQITMYLCRRELNLPYQKIGKLFSRDHSTVMTSIKQVVKKIEAGDSEIIGSVNSILSER